MAKCPGCLEEFEATNVTSCQACQEAMASGSKPSFKDAKQVILVRRDLNMPAGKLAAQVAHASLSCILQMGTWSGDTTKELVISLDCEDPGQQAVHSWLTASFPKIVLEVADEEAILAYADKARERGLAVSVIVDAGRTVFNGVCTTTTVGIGPGDRSVIDSVTGQLRMYR